MKGKSQSLKPVRFQGITIPLYRYKDGRTAFADSAGGPRKMRIFTDEAKARNEAEKLAIKLLNGEAVRTTFKAADQAAYTRALEILQPHGVALTLALEEWATARELCKGRSLMEVIRAGAEKLTLPSKSLPEVVEEFLLVKKSEEVSVHYFDQITYLLGKFAEAHPGPIGEVTPEQIQTYLLKMTVGFKRREACRGALVSVFRFARDLRGYLPRNERTAAEIVPVAGKHKTTISTWEPNEMRFWLQHVRREFKPWLAITAFSGVRTEEVCPPPKSNKDRLQWSDFNWKRGHIVIRPEVSKVGVRRLVPIMDNLENWLEPWKGSVGPVLPIGLEARRETNRLTKFSKALEKAMEEKKAFHPIPGLKWRQNANRHSYGSYRNAIIQNMPQLAEEMGNSVPMVKKHYHEAQDEDVAKDWFAIRPQNLSNIIQLGFQMAV